MHTCVYAYVESYLSNFWENPAGPIFRIFTESDHFSFLSPWFRSLFSLFRSQCSILLTGLLDCILLACGLLATHQRNNIVKHWSDHFSTLLKTVMASYLTQSNPSETLHDLVSYFCHLLLPFFASWSLPYSPFLYMKHIPVLVYLMVFALAVSSACTAHSFLWYLFLFIQVPFLMEVLPEYTIETYMLSPPFPPPSLSLQSFASFGLHLF